MDLLTKALAGKAGIRFAHVEVTVAAGELAARHLCGPTASLLLAEGLAGVALLSADTAQDDEAVSLNLVSDGPARGLLVEARGSGDLRGFTYAKILNDLDGNADISSAPALGAHGQAQLAHTLPGKILAQSVVQLDPPSVRTAVARILNKGLQRPAGVEIAAQVNAKGVLHARSFLAERMPDGDVASFVAVLEKFNDGSVAGALAGPEALEALSTMFGALRMEVREERGLRCRCTCTMDRVAETLKVLSTKELQDMVAEARAQHVVCTMCGKDYLVPHDRIAAILAGCN